MEAEQAVVFIHGLGSGPEAWAHQLAELPAGFAGSACEVPGLGASAPIAAGFSLSGAAAGILADLDRRGVEKAHLCGLSLGAMIAFRLAVDHPERVRSLTLAAGQVKFPRVLMAVQSIVLRMLPERWAASGSIGKAQMLAVLDAVARTDFSGELSSVTVPALVLCGSRDRANLPAARAFAAGMPRAELQILEGAGHQSNTQSPELFSAALNGFLRRSFRPHEERG